MDSSGTGSGGGSSELAEFTAGYTPLTFHPARDNPEQLGAFLSSVCERYTRQRGQHPLLGVSSIVCASNAHVLNVTAPLSRIRLPVAQSLQHGLQLSRRRTASDVASASSSHNHNRNPPSPPKAASPQNQTPRKQKATLKKAPPAAAAPAAVRRGGQRRRRSTNQASLLKAKNIDFHAPDPEENSPPNETESERRRRRERINGRRKRAKKMIEIDFLNEQYHKLREDNAKLETENETFRERISLLKGFRSSSSAAVAADAGQVIVQQQQFNRQLPGAEEEVKKPAGGKRKAAEGKESESSTGSPQHPSLLQYALAPSSLALRHVQYDTASSLRASLPVHREESKDSLVQPQFVGQERLDHILAAGASRSGAGNLLALTGLEGNAALLRHMNNTAAHPFGGGGGTLPSLYPQASSSLPPSSSIISALFQHRHQSQPAAAILGAHQLVGGPASPFPPTLHQMYQSMLSNQQSQHLSQPQPPSQQLMQPPSSQQRQQDQLNPSDQAPFQYQGQDQKQNEQDQNPSRSP